MSNNIASNSSEALVSTESPSRKTLSSKVDDVQLPSSEALPLDAANALAAEDRLSVVAVFGPVGSGKSTMIGSLHARFLQGGFPNISFAGSKTLCGFEAICHLGRAAAGIHRADTERTPLSAGLKFYHLAIDVESARHNLLLTDVSGEAIEAAIASDDGCKQLDYLPRADHVVFLLDGRRISQPLERHHAETQVVDLAKALAGADMIRATAKTYLVLSKDDLLYRHENAQRLYATAEKCLTRLKRIFPDQMPQDSVHRIAARADDNARPTADGISDLLLKWMHTRPIEARPGVQRISPPSHSFDRYLVRPRHELHG